MREQIVPRLDEELFAALGRDAARLGVSKAIIARSILELWYQENNRTLELLMPARPRIQAVTTTARTIAPIETAPAATAAGPNLTSPISRQHRRERLKSAATAHQPAAGLVDR